MKKALVRLVKRKLSMAFTTWREKAQGTAWQIDQARRVVLHMRHRTLAAAFQKWRLEGNRGATELYVRVTFAASAEVYESSAISIQHDISHHCGLQAAELALERVVLPDAVRTRTAPQSGCQ